METSNATSIKPPSHGTVRLLTGVAVVFIAICGGVLLGIASAHRAYFDAIVFVGGDHVKPTDPETQRLTAQASAEGKVLAAICAGQGILKEAGLWEGGRGGVYIERRDRIIVASGAIKARGFGEAIAIALEE